MGPGKLQDAVPPFPSTLAFEVLEEELGQPPSEVFSELSEEPVASASLSQVRSDPLPLNAITAMSLSVRGGADIKWTLEAPKQRSRSRF